MQWPISKTTTTTITAAADLYAFDITFVRGYLRTEAVRSETALIAALRECAEAPWAPIAFVGALSDLRQKPFVLSPDAVRALVPWIAAAVVPRDAEWIQVAYWLVYSQTTAYRAHVVMMMIESFVIPYTVSMSLDALLPNVLKLPRAMSIMSSRVMSVPYEVWLELAYETWRDASCPRPSYIWECLMRDIPDGLMMLKRAYMNPRLSVNMRDMIRTALLYRVRVRRACRLWRNAIQLRRLSRRRGIPLRLIYAEFVSLFGLSCI